MFQTYQKLIPSPLLKSLPYPLSRLPHYLLRITHPILHTTYHVLRSTPLFLLLFSIYLLTYTPRINSSDGLAMFSTAESLVRRGALDIEQIRWMGLQQGSYGLDGLLYSRKGIGLPLALLPLTWLGLAVPGLGTVSISLLFNPIITTLTAGLLSAYLQTLGYNRRLGLILGLIFGLCTLAWPYAKSLFSDPFSGFLLLAAAYALLKFHRANQHQLTPVPQGGSALPGTGTINNEQLTNYQSPITNLSISNLQSPISILYPPSSILYPLLAGLLLAWNVATRYAEALFVPLYGLLLLYYLTAGGPQKMKAIKSFSNFWLPILVFTLPLLVVAVALAVFNLSRYGDPLNTGYLPEESFDGALWAGIAGQLISPGRGLLLYCPILILSLWGFMPFLRRFRAEGILALSIILIHLLLYGKWFMWHGGYAWGPRFMIPTLPFWILFLAPVVAQVFKGDWRLGDWEIGRLRSITLGLGDYEREGPAVEAPPGSPTIMTNFQTRILRLIIPFLVLLSLIPQILSVTIDFSPFQNALLETGLPLFDRQTFFDPRYSPLIAVWALIKPTTLDFAWAWQGRINAWLLAILLVNIIITGWNFKRRWGDKEIRRLGDGEIRRLDIRESESPPSNLQPPISNLLPYLSTLISIIYVLAYTHTLPPKPFREAVSTLNEVVKPTDAVITNDPEIAMPFAEMYKGLAPVSGLNNGGPPLPEDITHHLDQIIFHHSQVWWLPNWLPPEESGIEQTLLANGFRARNHNFEGQRLLLFAYPDKLLANNGLNEAHFDNSIHLMKVAYPPKIAGGTAFPVELYWQTTAPLAENYHVFIHLLADQGQIVAQADGQPGQWARPTSTWQVGELIVDRHGLWIPAEVTAGNYQLWVGLYRPGDGRRLHLPNGADAVKISIY